MIFTTILLMGGSGKSLAIGRAIYKDGTGVWDYNDIKIDSICFTW